MVHFQNYTKPPLIQQIILLEKRPLLKLTLPGFIMQVTLTNVLIWHLSLKDTKLTRWQNSGKM